MEIKHLSRKEGRKKKRQEKNQKRQQSWLQRGVGDDREEEIGSGVEIAKEKKDKGLMERERKKGLEKEVVKLAKKDKGVKRKKSNLEEYLEEDKKRDALAAEYDLKRERMLAKKLKVKKGKFEGVDDILNDIFSGFGGIAGDDDLFDGLEVKNKKQKTGRESRKENENNGDTVGFETDGGTSEHDDDMDVLESEMEEKDNKGPLKKCKSRKKKKKLDDNLAGDILDDASEKANSTTEIPKEGDAPQESVPEKSVKYVPPHLRNTVKNELEEYAPMRRRIRGLLNRISESNVESITGEIFNIIQTVPRGIASQILNEEVLTSVADGPRGSEQLRSDSLDYLTSAAQFPLSLTVDAVCVKLRYAAVFAAFVAGMACLAGIDFGAKLVASLAKSFEDEYQKKDNISLRNLTLLLCYLCVLGVFSSDLVYDFLILLSKRLLETDVSTILTILQCCGMKLRSDDPAVMKDFILSVQNRVNEMKTSTGDSAAMIDNRRMEFMLETIVEIKNNKKKAKEDPVQLTRIKKWLQKIQSENIQLRGLKWSKLLDPNKKGQWWVSGDLVSPTDHIEDVANKIDGELLEAQKLIQLASKHGMNTDARKAIFCIIMSGEDCDDAFEKLLRLDIAGKQEKVFNKYYTVLASKLCKHNKNHKFSLQYCLWDHYKGLETMELQQSMHLARFAAEMFSSHSLSLAVLKAVDFSDLSQLTAKRVMHFRMLFESIFEFTDKTVWNIFTRIAAAPDLETLRTGIEFFIKGYVVSRNKSLANKFKLAKKGLNNLEGILIEENQQIKLCNLFKDLKELLNNKPDVVKWLEKVSPEKWALAYDTNGRRWASMTTNQSESFIYVLMACRDLPITAIVHFTLKQANSWFIKRRDKMLYHNNHLVPKIESIINENIEKVGGSEVQMYDRAKDMSRRTRYEAMHDVPSPSDGDDIVLPDLSHIEDPGPIVSTLLYKQPTHRYTRIWETSNYEVDWSFMTSLVERWRSETHTFHLHHGEMTITLEDVGVLMGLPIEARAVITNQEVDDALCLSLLGVVPPTGRRDTSVRCTWFRDNMKEIPEDASEEVIQGYARAYILVIVGEFPISGFLRNLCNACKSTHTQLSGCAILIQLWAWEHLIIGGPRRLAIPAPPPGLDVDPVRLPALGYKWNVPKSWMQISHHVLMLYRDLLDRQEANNVIWTPNTEEIKDYLYGNDLHLPIDGKKPEGMEDDVWKLLDRKAMRAVRLSLSRYVAYHTVKAKTMKEMLDTLSALYEKPSTANKVHLMRQLFNLRMAEGVGVAKHLSEFNMIIMQLSSVNIKFDEEIQALILLSSLPESWSGTVTVVSATPGKEELKLDEVRDLVVSEATRRKESESTSGLALEVGCSGRSKFRGNDGPVKDKSKVKCWNCDRFGHYKSECKEPSRDMLGSATTEDIVDALILSVKDPVEAWVLDSGASFHSCSSGGIMENYISGDFGKVYLGDVEPLEVAGKGDVRIKTPDGSILQLRGVRHIPGLKKNLLSVGQLDEDGYDVTFNCRNWKIAKGARVIAQGKKEGTLYNVRNVQNGIVGSGGSGDANLWHCCCGHMNQKVSQSSKTLKRRKLKLCIASTGLKT
ncbi:unnamed protein product [Rhodiola kirilowii]